MTQARELTLGGATFAVPRIPIRLLIDLYPRSRRLTAGGLIDRVAAAGGALDASQAEMDDLVEIAFGCAIAADGTLTREAFLALPISPPELLDAFVVAQFQTGAWAASETEACEEARSDAQ